MYNLDLVHSLTEIILFSIRSLLKPVESHLEKELKEMVKLDESKKDESLLGGLEHQKIRFRKLLQRFFRLFYHKYTFTSTQK